MGLEKKKIQGSFVTLIFISVPYLFDITMISCWKRTCYQKRIVSEIDCFTDCLGKIMDCIKFLKIKASVPEDVKEKAEKRNWSRQQTAFLTGKCLKPS